MAEDITIVKGPISPRAPNFIKWESPFHIVYSVSLDSGLIVTNPDQFPEQPPEKGEAAFPIEK